jgi:UDP-N-acetylglucosamine acyltransferase
VAAATARIDPGARIGPGVRIGEYCVIESDVTIGAGTVLEPYVYVKRWTTVGENNEIGAGTVLGTDPLDKNFGGARSYLRIGNGNKIREHFTISRGTPPESATEIGDGNFIMTSGHIAHNCRIGNGAVIASCVLLGGYVEVGDGAFLSGGVLVHQYSKVGRLAMVSGNTRVNLDAPPFFTFAGFEIAPKGLNLVGLRRAGFGADQVSTLKRAYRYLYRSNFKLAEALERIEAELASPETRELVTFIRTSRRGICRP